MIKDFQRKEKRSIVICKDLRIILVCSFLLEIQVENIGILDIFKIFKEKYFDFRIVYFVKLVFNIKVRLKYFYFSGIQKVCFCQIVFEVIIRERFLERVRLSR